MSKSLPDHESEAVLAYAHAVFRVVFYHPEIPANTGNAIRLAACTGASLHLVEPLGFSFEDAKLRRAGLDYHDLAVLRVHPSFDAFADELHPQRVIAFTSWADHSHTELNYQPGDALLFGPESVGLPDEMLHDERVTHRVRIPMRSGVRSLNLSNSAAIAVYEAWRQQGFTET